jgi:hypothetical protein
MSVVSGVMCAEWSKVGCGDCGGVLLLLVLVLVLELVLVLATGTFLNSRFQILHHTNC